MFAIVSFFTTLAIIWFIAAFVWISGSILHDVWESRGEQKH